MKEPNVRGPVLDLADILEAELSALQETPERRETSADSQAPATPTDDPSVDLEARLRAIYSQIHAQKEKRSALCLSGGGIRSATFSLGVVQALAKANLLGRFDYLSTVSGGGYLGGWLSAWIKNRTTNDCTADGRDAVLLDLAAPPAGKTLDPEWPPIRFLRSYSNYLAPRLSLFSADTWTLVATFLRNMLLNWSIIVPTLLAALFVPRFIMAATLSIVPDYVQVLAWIFTGILSAISTAYSVFDMAAAPANEKVKGSAAEAPRNESAFFVFKLLPLTGAAYLAMLAWAWRYNSLPKVLPGEALSAPTWPELLLLLGLSNVVGAAAGFLLRMRRHSSPGGVKAPVLDRFKRAIGSDDDDAASHGKWHWARPVIFSGSVLAVALLAARAIQAMAGGWFSRPTENSSVLEYVSFAAPLLLAVYLLANYLLAGLSSRVTDDGDREWWGRSSGWILLATVAIALQNCIVYWGTYWLELLEQTLESPGQVQAWVASVGGISGIATALLGASSKFSAKEKTSGENSGTWLAAGAVVFLVLFDALLAFATQKLAGDYYSLTLTGPWSPEKTRMWLSLLVPLSIGIGMSWFVNVNIFSLHTMYRNRLVRAYLGASNLQRSPHPFTGFDPRDNPHLHELSTAKPLHIFNIALNLVSTENLAWQERKAESFTMSRLHCGSWDIGYQPTETYGRGIRLGTAMTISGAAANPNMGYHSSPLVGLIMTLFNVRLGWWLANPGPHGCKVWDRRGPVWALGPLFSEAIGLTTRRYRYVNLSDGGHFENLGIYEMVLRRAHTVVAVDAGQDDAYIFNDLGNAIRKIRIDFGIPITIHTKGLSSKSPQDQRVYYARGTIHYSQIDAGAKDGDLIYLKPILRGDEPADVLNYQAAHPEFPHESTADQFFSESQLESYRMLGYHAATRLTKEKSFASLEQFIASLPAPA